MEILWGQQEQEIRRVPDTIYDFQSGYDSLVASVELDEIIRTCWVDEKECKELLGLLKTLYL
jgi:hypothetical protein